MLLAIVAALGVLAAVPRVSADPGPPPPDLVAITTADTFRVPHADVLRLYFAVFDRWPDAAGAAYWLAEYDRGVEPIEIAAAMTASAEFAARYGALDDPGFLDTLYRNVLDREPDDLGRAYWSELLAERILDRHHVVVLFSVAEEFRRGHRFPGEEDALPGPPPERPVTVGSGPALLRVSIEVEPAIAATSADVAADAVRILGDRRSWIAEGRVRFRIGVDPAEADIRVRVAAPSTVDRRCRPLRTGGYLSCRNGSSLNINVDRWNGATSFWRAGVPTYRAYLLNHEMGHYLGHGHVGCPGPGRLAPVMQQQTKSLGGCVENGWPYPE